MKITREIIEEAKKVAKEDYENTMKKINAHNPHYKRAWVKHDFPGMNAITFALEGTPDKAFVLYYPRENKVVAMRQDRSVIKVWE